MQIIFIFLTWLSANSSYIPYQAHGFNDLSYMLQQVKKGITYFKMDVASANRESCVKHARIDFCEIYSSGFEICCLGFRGDTASLPVFKQSFNITSQLKEFIIQNEYYFKHQEGFYSETKVLAFNFHYSDEDLMKSLTKKFLVDLVTLMADFNIKIIFGSDRLIYEYRIKCNTECDPIDRLIASAPFKFQTTSQYAQGSDHVHFNTFFKEINNLCIYGWPEWVNEFKITFWEPSHEYQVQECRKAFYDPQCAISDQLRDVNNLAIASNLEPETFQIHWKELITQTPFDSEDQKLYIQGKIKNPKIDFISDKVIISYQIDDTIYVQLYLSDFTLIYQMILIGNLKDLRVNGEYILLVQTDKVQILTFKNNQLCLESTIETKLSTRLINNILVQITNTNNEFILEFKSLNEQTIATINIDAGPIETIINLTFDVAYNDGYFIIISFSRHDYLHEHDYYKKIFTSLVQVSNDFTLIEYIPAHYHIDYGIISDIKLQNINGKIIILAVYSDSGCQAAILLNNNDWNKCQFLNKAEYQSMRNVDGMINYMYGVWEDFRDRIVDKTVVNGCDERIIHAKLGNGRNPNIAFKHDQAFVISEIMKYSEQGTFTQLFCGSSNEGLNDGALLYSFDLVPVEELIK